MASEKIMFKGPAGLEFGSLHEQASYFLDNYWPRWRDYDHPRSYIIPPIFEYKFPEVTSEALQMQARESLIGNRMADEAKHMVFNALHELIMDRIQVPFMAVHNLNVEKIKYHVKKELHSQWGDIFREYDYVIIGPSIGVVVIEVKSSQFKRQGGLTSDYIIAVDKLVSADRLVRFLGEHADLGYASDILVRKVIFTPNLKKSRFVDWLDGLDNFVRINADDKLEGIVTWFQEDMINDEGANAKPPLYSAMRTLFTTISSSVGRAEYEAFTPIIVAVSSVTVIHSAIGKKSLVFSEQDAIEKEHRRIIDQNPLLGRKSTNLKKGSKLQRIPKEIRTGDFNAAFFLTPDQLTALNGPNRQIIIGAAGTGKTIVLQAKALELLRKQCSITVLAPRSYMRYYQRLFDWNDFQNYKISNWTHAAHNRSSFELCKYLDSRRRDGLTLHEKLEQFITIAYQDIIGEFEWLQNSDAVFIDDAFDTEYMDFAKPERLHLTPLLAMAIAHKTYPQKLIWVAADPNTPYSVNYPHKKLPIVNIDDLLHTPNCTTTILAHVIRCSESIFNHIYSDIPEITPQVPRAVMAHKIQGAPTEIVCEHYATLEEATNRILTKISSILDDLFAFEKHNARNIGIVTGRFPGSCSKLCAMIYDQCKNAERDIAEAYPSDYQLDLYPEIEYPDVHIIREHGQLKEWHNVSSLEWPVVIYVSCMSRPMASSDDDNILRYQRYRAMTRATVKLIDISVTFDYDIEPIDQQYITDLTLIQKNWETEMKCLGNILPTCGPLGNRLQPANVPNTQDFDNFYPNLTNPKGPALIISNSDFTDKIPDRPGCKVDLENMWKLLNSIGYQVIVWQNLSVNEMRMAITDFIDWCNKYGFRFNSLIMYISTYCIDGKFLGVDGRALDIPTFLKPVVENKGFEGKPKFVIIHGCRLQITPIETSDSVKETRKAILKCERQAQSKLFRSIPDAEDTCFLHSTCPGYYNWSNGEEHGSWFIQALIQAITLHGNQPFGQVTTLITTANKLLCDAFTDVRLPILNAALMNMPKSFHFMPQALPMPIQVATSGYPKEAPMLVKSTAKAPVKDPELEAVSTRALGQPSEHQAESVESKILEEPIPPEKQTQQPPPMRKLIRKRLNIRRRGEEERKAEEIRAHRKVRVLQELADIFNYFVHQFVKRND